MIRRATAIGAGCALAFLLSGCGPDYPKCEKDSHCHEGEYCVNGLCQQCRDDGDCPDGQSCASGACREIAGYCRDGKDCAAGQVCRDKRCGPCMAATDCADGQVCMDGICGVAECRTTEDCAAGLSCINYKCQVDKAAASGLGPGDCVLEPIYFAFDSSEVADDMKPVVQKDADCLQKRGGKVVLEGHTDPRGTTEYNMALGERRSRIVHKFATTLGVDAGSMRVISRGEEDATGNDETSWVKDRRVEFK
jgi:peptidoglycan-associated lipoprotein